jgi:4'-phosphopantetheinyl transferase
MTTQGAQAWTAAGARVIFLGTDSPDPAGALSAAEAERLAAFRLDKRRREWLAGRLAAKSLLAAAESGPLSSYEIGIDKYGRPSCGGRLVSISHSNGWALAAYKPGCAFLGADLEKVEERHPAWYSDYFHPAELPAPDPSAATRLWAVKEAMMKALGLGLMVDPLDIRVTAKGVELRGKAQERHAELGSPAFDLETRPFPEGFWTAVIAAK